MGIHTGLRESSSAYDAIVVGSGYGGGVAAARLARMGYKVAVFEQGRHWRPGDFPTSTRARRKQLRLDGRAPKWGDPTSLYYLSFGKGITVFGASGLGGGSLINAGVTLRPDLDRLKRMGWPAAVTDDGLLAQGLARAEVMLGTAPAPAPERFAKFNGMRRLAEASGIKIQAPPMTISHAPGLNVVGVMQYGCRSCGDCWSGCNAGAKNTIGITYIVDAIDHGAQVFCETRVDAFAKTANGWRVDVTDLSGRRRSRQRTTMRIEAPMLVLGAGTMGTNQLLLRAARDGLALSERLGRSFSANGDDLVIASELDPPSHAVAVGFPSQAPPGVPAVGPHSMALIDLGDERGPVWAHDGTMLAVMAAMAPVEQILKLQFREALKIKRQGIYGDDLARNQMIYVVGQDDASGRLVLQGDHVVVDWPGYSADADRVRAEQKVKALIEKSGAEFVENPFAMTAFGGNRVIAHPLGGAGMGDTCETGVVAHDGRVFDPRQGPDGVHEGLYVCDGAAIPSAVGVSPLLTITALAERAMMLAAKRLGRPLDVTTTPPRPPRDALM